MVVIDFRDSIASLRVHDNVVVATPGLADRAGFHASVLIRHNGDLERLGFNVVPEADTAEGTDGLDHRRSQLHLMVDLTLFDGRIQFIHRLTSYV